MLTEDKVTTIGVHRLRISLLPTHEHQLYVVIFIRVGPFLFGLCLLNRPQNVGQKLSECSLVS